MTTRRSRAELAPVHREGWWEQASPEQIGRAWETAVAWRELDRDVARASERIGGELRERYEIDVEDLGAGARPDVAPENARARGERGDAVALLAAAQRDERIHEHDHGPEARPVAVAPYDSVQRRQALAEKLASAGVEPDAVQARVLADTSQGRAPEEALAGDQRVPRARRARGHAPRSEITRPDRGR